VTDGRWRRWWTALSTTAKVITAFVSFASAVVALYAALVALSVVSNPFESPTDRLVKAGRALTEAGSARVNVSRLVKSGSRQNSDTAEGNIDFRGENGTLDFASGLKIILRRPYLWESLPKGHGVWCVFDLTSLGSGILWGALTGFQSDPGAAVRNLQQLGDYKNLGDEILFGIPVTHYAGQVHLDKLMAQPAVNKKLLRQFISENGSKLPVDVWLGKADNRVVQLAGHEAVPGGPYGLRGKVTVDITYGFSHFGVNVPLVKAPTRTADPGTRGCPLSP
jgi:hypothetical protein